LDDFQAGYRSEQEAQQWIDRDPVRLLGTLLDPATRKGIETEVTQAVLDAFEFAAESPFPVDSELWDHVYGDPP
jgi:TPP-dependent pyruvate/acetoin dehydrogenase alpha subunit